MRRIVPCLLGLSVVAATGACATDPIDPPSDDGAPSTDVSSSAGSYTPPPWVPAFTSGARLRARVFDAGGQARSFIGWFDSALGFDCVSTPVVGGPNRCMPPLVGAVVYLDDECTEAAATLPTDPVSGSAPPFVVDEHAGDQLCGSYRGWSVGASQTVTTVFELAPGGACEPVLKGATVHALAPVALDTFAALDVTNEEISGFAWRQVERGADGSFRAVSGLDGPNGDPCEVLAAPFGARRWCLPKARVRRADVYADGGCGERAIPLDPCELNSLAPIVDLREDRCIDETPYVYAAGDIVDVLFTEDGVCGVGAPGKGRKLGAKQPINDPPAADSRGVPGEVLDLVLDVFADVPIRADGSFMRDAGDFTSLCEARKTPIGTRCIPPFILHGRTYADAACTTKVVPLEPSLCPPVLYIGVGVANASIEHVHSFGAVVSGQIYSDATGTCEPIPSGDATWYGFGDEIPLYTFDVLASFVE